MVNSLLSVVTEWEGLQRRNSESFSAVWWWLHRKNFIQKPKASGQGAGGKSHRWRAAGTVNSHGVK